MKMRNNKKLLSFLLCMVLIVAAALFTNGCNGSTGSAASSGTEAGTENVQADNGESTSPEAETGGAGSGSVLGEGAKTFVFTVTDRDGNETAFEIHTDKETVGEALLEVGLIEGEDSEYGLYVKSVNGITADYDTDGVYWAFYVNGEYAQSGVDTTAITEGDSYSFKVE